jgi:hypothetical protein
MFKSIIPLAGSEWSFAQFTLPKETVTKPGTQAFVD